MARRLGLLRPAAIVCAVGAALLLLSLSLAPAKGAGPAQDPGVRTVQVWPDRSAGVADGGLVGPLPIPASLAHPYGVAVAQSGEVVHGRTYLSFPTQVFPPGTDVIRATLYAHADSASRSGESQLGVYGVTQPWDTLVPGGNPSTWPALLGAPVSTSLVQASGPTLGRLPGPAGSTATNGRVVRVPGLAVPPSDEDTQLRFEPSEVGIGVGVTSRMAIWIEGARAVQRVELEIEYDQEVLEVVDADPTTDGVQIEVGPFLGSGGADVNQAAEDRGEIEFAHSSASGGVSGSGILAWISFRGTTPGSSAVQFSNVSLQDEEERDQPANPQAASITVGPTPSAPESPTPSATASPTPGAVSTPTPIGVADPTVTVPPSPLPTPVPGDLEGRFVSMNAFSGTWISWDVTALLRAWLSEGAVNNGLAIASAPVPDAGTEVAGDLLLARWLTADDPETFPYLIVEYRVLPVTPTPVPSPPPILPPAGQAGPARLVGLVGLALAGLSLVALGAWRVRRDD